MNLYIVVNTSFNDRDKKEVCNYKEGLELMKTISTIQEQNR